MRAGDRFDMSTGQEHEVTRPISGRGVAWGRHVHSGQALRLVWEEGRFATIAPVEERELGPEAAATFLAPALFDPQINGFAGVDYQRDDLEPEAIAASFRALWRYGCTRLFVTFISDDWDRLLARLRRWRQWCRECPELRRSIAGWHFEGPFLSTEPGYCGAHDPKSMPDPTPEHMKALREAAEEDSVLVTLAPERHGALETIRAAAQLGIRVSLGHTNAGAAVLAAARAAGATGFTHLGNACPQQLDRHDNLLWRVLDQPGWQVGLIADGNHVAAPLFRLIHRLLPAPTVWHTTDAMAAAAAPPGRYTLGWLELEVGADRIVRLPGGSHFAGSALTPIEGVERAAAMLGCSWRAVWSASSVYPACWLGVELALRPGHQADFCALQVDASDRPVRLSTWLAGEQVGELVLDELR